MKALSIHPLFVDMIINEEKTIEVRTWKTNYRGDILICSTAKKLKGTIPSHALCVVRLADVVPLKKKHLNAACMSKMPNIESYAWILEDIRIIKPIPIKGRLGLWNFEPEDKIEYIPDVDTEEEAEALAKELWGDIEI